MTEEIFDISCPVFTKYLSGEERQNLSRVNKHLRCLVTSEHKHSIFLEFQRLVTILTDVDAPYSERVRTDALFTWRLQDENIDSYFSLLCATLKILPKRSYFQLIITLMKSVPKKVNTFQQLLFYVEFCNDNLNSIVKISDMITQTPTPCNLEKIDHFVFFFITHPSIRKHAFKRSAPFVQLLEKNNQWLPIYYHSIFIVVNTLLKDHVYHLTQREINSMPKFNGFFRKEIVEYTDKEFKSQLRFKKSGNHIFNLVPHKLVQQLAQSNKQQIHYEVIKNCLNFFDSNTLAKRSHFMLQNKPSNFDTKNLIFPIKEMIDRSYAGPQRYPKNYYHTKPTFQRLIQVFSPSRLTMLDTIVHPLILDDNEELLLKLANSSFKEYLLVSNFVTSPLFCECLNMYQINRNHFLTLMPLSDMTHTNKLHLLIQNYPCYKHLLQKPHKTYNLFGFQKFWFGLSCDEITTLVAEMGETPIPTDQSSFKA